MNKFVKFNHKQNHVGVITFSGPRAKGDNDTAVAVRYHNGIKVATGFFEPTSFTEITAAEFELTVRKNGHTSMLQFLVTTEIEAIVWHTDPNDLPDVGMYCLVLTKAKNGIERASFTGQDWRMSSAFRNERNWITAWAYEPKGPKN